LAIWISSFEKVLFSSLAHFFIVNLLPLKGIFHAQFWDCYKVHNSSWVSPSTICRVEVAWKVQGLSRIVWRFEELIQGFRQISAKPKQVFKKNFFLNFWAQQAFCIC
jgi:hypothetical protein